MNDYSDLFSLAGKTAVVTGGTRGIGEMIATGFVNMGVKTYVTSRKAGACDAIKEKLGCEAAPFDLSTMDGVEGFAEYVAEREEKIDILVNNAGALWAEPLELYTEEGWDRTIDLNVKSVFFLTQKLLPQLRAAVSVTGRGRVINIGSVEGLTTPAWDNYAYPISKAAVHQMTKVLANRLAKDKITVNAIAPGPFESKMTAFVLANDAGKAAVGAAMPLGRIGMPDDMVGLSAFLASRASDYITGAVIPLDGGFVIGARSWD